MSKPAHPVGLRIREARRLAQRSAKELAKAAGVSRGHLSQIERGQKTPSMEALARIAGALDLTLAHLLTIEASPPLSEALAELERRWPISAEERALLASVFLAGHRPATVEAYLLVLLAIRQACGPSVESAVAPSLIPLAVAEAKSAAEHSA